VPLTDATEQGLLNHFWGKATWTPDATLYVGASSTTPTDAGGNITEPVGNGYARVAIDEATQMGLASGVAPAVLANTAVIAHAQASANWTNQPMTHFVLFAVPSGGTSADVRGWGVLGTARTVLAGDTASYAVGALQTKLGKSGDPF
jgi:hypothetical protein